MLKRTIHICPTEGVVTPDQSHTHIYTLTVNGDNITIDITNKGFLTATPLFFTINTTKAEMRMIATTYFADDLIGDIDSLLVDFPDNFIETMHHMYIEVEDKITKTNI